MHETDSHITLGDAAKLAPGRPSTNCIWRWCRRGVLSRGGERIRLQHVRAGGKIFTTAEWVDQFVRRLAEADAAYFDRRDQMPATPPAARTSPFRGRRALLDRQVAVRRRATELGLDVRQAASPAGTRDS
ncbi:MAG: DUF1580 domain-containing protein [Phycisphaerae bacterium]|nr:DUF1580 domain-containing protein [Phycisphaerae bacterium]